MNLLTELSELKRKVDFNTYDISVKELISMVSDEIIDIAPAYQRQFRWKDDRQSQLIESIFLGIPVPSLFMATNLDGTWELIDGVQRLSSIIHFAGTDDATKKIQLDSKLKLQGLTKLTTFNNKFFSDLPKTVQLELLLKPLKITTLSDKSDMDVRFDLFERLNTGGIVLTNQEIRSCVYRGKFNDFIKELSTDPNFVKTVRLTASQETDGTRDEFVLRFFAFLNNYQNFEHSVVQFLNEYMNHATKKFDYKTGENIFKTTFESLLPLPEGITKNRSTTPTNFFEGVAVGAALAITQNRIVITDNLEWMQSAELRVATSGATNTKAKVTRRIEYCRDKFLGL
ncbi:MAG: DUF262 domain-containing protein [Methylotenera sp.]|nr:DUF262 domain-containing protein [Flavobacterium sp.]